MFVNCIQNSARLKCNPQSAVYALKAARMLTDEIHFSNCRPLEAACAHAVRIAWLSSALLSMLLMILLRIVRCLVTR